MRSIAAFTASVLNASRRNCLVVALTVITLLATITGCSGGGGGGGITNPVTVTSVSNTATPSSIQMGQTSTCLGTVTYSNNTSDHAVSYTATGGTITPSGVFTPTAVGAASCTATSTMDATKSFTATITVTAVAPPAPTITATPAGPLNQGQSTTIAWNANAGTGASANISGPNLTTSTALTGSVSVAPPTGTDTYTITATNAGGSTTASVTVTVNAPAPTASLVCTPNSVTLGSTVSCTIASTNATQVIASSTDGSWAGSVTLNGTVSVTPTSTTGSVVYGVTANGSGGSATASSGTITVTNTAIQLTSIVPAVKWVVGQGGYVPFTFYGSNLNPGITIATNPDANVQYGQSQFDNSEAIVYLGIDQIHEGSGWRSAQACKSAGTGCSKVIPFGLYGQNTSAAATSGEIFTLNPQETVAGQNVFNGVPSNGYVDKFTPAGAPDGKFYVGAGCCIALDPTTGFVIVDGRIYDQNGGVGDTPALSGGFPQPLAGNAAANGFDCLLQPTAASNLSCANLTGSPFIPTQIMSVNVGTNPQSLAMGVVGGKTWVFVLTGGSAPALWSVDVTDGMTNITSQPVTGVTANLPGGSAVTVFDSLGVGIVTSFGDNLAIPFSLTTLKPTGNAITLPGVPVSAVANTVNGIAVIGNADQANNGGTLTEVNPTTGTATLVPTVETTVLPVGTAPATTGKGFLVCPQDGVSPCTSYTLP